VRILPVLLLCLLFLSVPAFGGLIGSNVHLEWLNPDTSTLYADYGSTTVGAGVEYSGLLGCECISFDISDTQIKMIFSGPSDSFGTGAFNGAELLFTGVSITGATNDAASNILPVGITLQGNNIFLNYQGDTLNSDHYQSIIDVTTGSGTPEPSSMGLVGLSLCGGAIAFVRSRRKTSRP
jgi:PEP-CTERM motif